MKKKQLDWFSVRCVFRSTRRSGSTKRNLYEERITIWRVASFNDAIKRAERDARQYAEDTDSEYIELAQAFHISPNRLTSGTEVFSLMRESNYYPKKYLDTYFDNGNERQEIIP